MENYKLISYAVDFVSFLIQSLDSDVNTIKNIYLFGSVARGDADKNSDIDLFVVGNFKKDLDLDAFEKKQKARIQLLIKSRDEFTKMQKENKNLANSILNGFVIKGYIEVFIWNLKSLLSKAKSGNAAWTFQK